MPRIQVGCALSYTVTQPSSFLFNIAAARTLQQTISEENFQLTPATYFETFTLGTDGIQLYRLAAGLGELQIQYETQVELYADNYEAAALAETDVLHLPYDVLPYLNPSRYCESDRLTHFASRLFGNSVHGYVRVIEICDWINSNLTYQAGSSGESTSACDV